MSAGELAAGVVLVTAPNPGPFTLEGTNTWLVGDGGCVVIDPGPAIDSHLNAVLAAAEPLGGIAAIAVTHDHDDHAEGAPALRERCGGAPIAAVRAASADVHLRAGDRVGPLTTIPTPGHAPDHVAFVAGGVCFSGDAVLGSGSVFIAPDPGALRGYLDALGHLRELGLRAICPGHGPFVPDAAAKLGEIVAHRLERERALVAALDDGLRDGDALLDRVWADAPASLRVAAAVTLAAHLDKLADEGRLPSGVRHVVLPVPGSGPTV